MENDIYIPKHKFDYETVDRIKNSSPDTIKPVLPYIFEWLEDINWPVAQELAKVMIKFDDLIIPFIKDLIHRPDGLRENSVYFFMLPLLSEKQLILLKDELERIAYYPSQFESGEGYFAIAEIYLQKLIEVDTDFMNNKRLSI